MIQIRDRAWFITAATLEGLAASLIVVTILISPETQILEGRSWILNAVRLAGVLVGTIGILVFGCWLSGIPIKNTDQN